MVKLHVWQLEVIAVRDNSSIWKRDKKWQSNSEISTNHLPFIIFINFRENNKFRHVRLSKLGEKIFSFVAS